jgi:protein ImuB
VRIGEAPASMSNSCATGMACRGDGSWNGIAMDISTKQKRRIVALVLPRLATDRLHRKRKASGKPFSRPLVVADKIANALRLTAVDIDAARLGLKPGMALADARARIPDLAVANADSNADLKLLEAIADACERYTPLVALDPPNGLFLDITGAAHLFGGEPGILDQIRTSIVRQDFCVHAALAGTADAARALARFGPREGGDGAVIPAGKEAKAVSRLPAEALGVDEEIIHALKRAGLKSISQVADRGRGELRSRFGSEFVFTLDCLLGRTERPLQPRAFVPEASAERGFADPVVSETAIADAIHLLAANLGSRLERTGQGARRFEACFFRADGQMRRIAVETGEAVRNPDVVDLLFREKLDGLADALDPGFGFDLIRLSASFLQPVNGETAGFGTKDHAREIRQLADRLTARFGAQRVLVYRPQDTHIPEAESVAVPAQAGWDAKIAWPPKPEEDDGPHRPLRLFARPEAIEAIAEIPDGPPLRFRWRNALHHVVMADGPERIAPEWWRGCGDEPVRDYFRVQDSQGRRFWIYREGIYGRGNVHPYWYMHGSFA